MSRSFRFTGAVVLLWLSGFSALAQTAVTSAVVAKLDRPIDQSQLRRPNQLFMTHVVSSQDPNISSGAMLGVVIDNAGIHAAVARSTAGIMHFTSPAATASYGTASGTSISIPAGEYICFNVPGTCGPSSSATAGSTAPSAVTAPSDSAAPSTSGQTASGQYPFALEGIGMRMTLAQVRAAAKAAGSLKGLEKQGPTTYNFKTRDLSFQIELTNAGQVRQYNVSDLNPKHAHETATSGPLYDKLGKAFGPSSSWPQGAVNYDLGEGGGAFAVVTDMSVQ